MMKLNAAVLIFLLAVIGFSSSCSEEYKDGEFYGQITYKVSVGGAVDSSILYSLQEMFGDSIEVSFTDKGYRLNVYKDTLVTEWYENDKGMIYFHMSGVDTLYYEEAKENNSLMAAEHRSDRHTHLGRDCKTYYLQDDRFHIEMWYDSTLKVSPKRFSRLYQGHYNRYYLDCASPYLVRSLVMAPINIRIEAIRIEQSDKPDPAWSERPDYPLIPFNEN